MGWQRGNNPHLTAANVKAGMTLLAVWDTVAGDDLSASFDRNSQRKKDIPTSTMKNGYTEHVVIQ